MNCVIGNEAFFDHPRNERTRLFLSRILEK